MISQYESRAQNLHLYLLMGKILGREREVECNLCLTLMTSFDLNTKVTLHTCKCEYFLTLIRSYKGYNSAVF